MRRHALLAPVLLAAVAAGGCGAGGSSKLLRDADAAGLKGRLDEIRAAVDARDVQACAARVRRLSSDIENLPTRVDRRLRARLRDEVARTLGPEVTAECDDPLTQTQPTLTTPAPSGPTGPTGDEQDTIPTGTTPTPSVPSIPTPSVPSIPTPSVPTDPGDDGGGFSDDGSVP